MAARESLSPIERLLILLHPWVALLVMPAFTLANAGVRLGPNVPATSMTWAVFFGLAIGKSLGILLFIWLGVQTRWVRTPPEISPRMLLGGALLGGIGFTMSLLIAAIAFEPALLDNAKRGILYASLFAAVTGTLVLRWRGTPLRGGRPAG